MEKKFMREYAAKIAAVFAIRATNAKKRGEKENYIQELEARRDLWEKVASLPTNSDKWEIVEEYICLITTPKTSKMELRRQYKTLQEGIDKTQLTNSQIFQI